MEPQFTGTNRPPWRPPAAWIACANSSLPVPDSPKSTTGRSLPHAFLASSTDARSSADRPRIRVNSYLAQGRAHRGAVVLYERGDHHAAVLELEPHVRVPGDPARPYRLQEDLAERYGQRPCVRDLPTPARTSSPPTTRRGGDDVRAGVHGHEGVARGVRG